MGELTRQLSLSTYGIYPTLAVALLLPTTRRMRDVLCWEPICWCLTPSAESSRRRFDRDSRNLTASRDHRCAMVDIACGWRTVLAW